MRLLLLPGLDGTGTLFRRFQNALPDHVSAEVVAYPADAVLSYGKLTELVRDHLTGSTVPTVLVAESFSGPVGIRVAADPPDHLRGLVLVATFAEPPAPTCLRPLIRSPAFWLSPPATVVRRYLVGEGAPAELVSEVREAVGSVAPRVLAARLRQVLAVDVREQLRRITIPVLYLEGRRDRLLRSRRALAQVRPDLDWRVLDAPHLVLQRRPAEAAETVVSFASDLTESGP